MEANWAGFKRVSRECLFKNCCCAGVDHAVSIPFILRSRSTQFQVESAWATPNERRRTVMHELKEFIVGAFCIVSMVLTLVKVILIEFDEIIKRRRKR